MTHQYVSVQAVAYHQRSLWINFMTEKWDKSQMKLLLNHQTFKVAHFVL